MGVVLRKNREFDDALLNFKKALETEGIHVIYEGHSRIGRGHVSIPTQIPV
jgi:ribosomal protein S21